MSTECVYDLDLCSCCGHDCLPAQVPPCACSLLTWLEATYAGYDELEGELEGDDLRIALAVRRGLLAAG
jgi:hypothetical protein